MSYRFDATSQVYKGKQYSEYLIVSPTRSLHITASNSYISDLLNNLIADRLDIDLLRRIEQNEQASALLNELINLDIVRDEGERTSGGTEVAEQASKSICIVSTTEALGLSERFNKCGYMVSDEQKADFYVIVANPSIMLFSLNGMKRPWDGERLLYLPAFMGPVQRSAL